MPNSLQKKFIVLFLSILAGTPALAAKKKAEIPVCPYPPAGSGPFESTPQSAVYRGGCLEPLTYVEGSLGRGQVPKQLTARYGANDAKKVVLDVKPAGEDDGNWLKDSHVPLYTVSYQGKNLCDGQTYDRKHADHNSTVRPAPGAAVAVPGYWSQGQWREKDGRGQPAFTFSCFTGVVAKCMHWGYVPWHKTGCEDRSDLHHACVQAARARYDVTSDRSYTCSETQVDMMDAKGVLSRTENPKLFTFESLWDKNGLVCMAHSRWQGCEVKLKNLKVPQCDSSKDPLSTPQPWSGSPGLIAVYSRTDQAAPNRDAPKEIICPDDPRAACPN